jgi:serine/threonine protein kinase
MSENNQDHRFEPAGTGTRSHEDASEGEGAVASDGSFEIPVPDWERFTITDFIGAGSMGRVYRAVDRRLKRPVALKFLRSEDPEQIRRFQREASSQAQIDHDHVCRIYDVGEVEGMPYIAMQYIDGRPLSELTEELTLETKVQLMEQVAEGAQAAHSIGVVHRDIKPENIMVERVEGGGYRAYVLDFGIAREMGGPSLTVEGVVVGTPAYMAPEQIKGDPDLIDRRVDVYGMGATLYDLVAGVVPFSGSTRVETLMQVLSDDPQPLRQLDRRIPVDLDTIVSKCLEKDPSRRYASARALADDLRRCLDREPIAARRPGWASRVAKCVQRLVG